MSRFIMRFNPGDFGQTMGHLDGMIDAASSEKVHHAIGRGFLKYAQKRAFKAVDLEARTDAGFTSGGAYRYAYAGGNPDNIGRPEKRLFSSGVVKKSGAGYEIGYDIHSDTEAAWSPVLLENTDWVYRDRMQDAMGPRIEDMMYAPTSRGKKVYAVAREGNDIVYSKHFRRKIGGKQSHFEKLLQEKMDEEEEGAEPVVNPQVHSAITKAWNSRTGVSGSTGASKALMSGYTANFKRAGRLVEQFMYAEMAKVIREA